MFFHARTTQDWCNFCNLVIVKTLKFCWQIKIFWFAKLLQWNLLIFIVVIEFSIEVYFSVLSMGVQHVLGNKLTDRRSWNEITVGNSIISSPSFPETRSRPFIRFQIRFFLKTDEPFNIQQFMGKRNRTSFHVLLAIFDTNYFKVVFNEMKRFLFEAYLSMYPSSQLNRKHLRYLQEKLSDR